MAKLSAISCRDFFSVKDDEVNHDAVVEFQQVEKHLWRHTDDGRRLVSLDADGELVLLGEDEGWSHQRSNATRRHLDKFA